MVHHSEPERPDAPPQLRVLRLVSDGSRGVLALLSPQGRSSRISPGHFHRIPDSGRVSDGLSHSW